MSRIELASYMPPAPEPTIEVQYIDIEGRLIAGRSLRFTYAQFRRNIISRLDDCRSVRPGFEDDPRMVAYRKNFEQSCLYGARLGALDPNEALSWVDLASKPYPPKEADDAAAEPATADSEG